VLEKQKAVKPQEPKRSSPPPGQIKLVDAMRELLRDKDFNSITTAEISRTAGVNEALIYRYLKDKRGLLHEVLTKYWDEFTTKIEMDLKGIEGALNKLRKLIWCHIDIYDRDRVIAKILLLEVRNFQGYFESETYQVVKRYAGLLLSIIREGAENGEIRDDISPPRIRDLILGGIEHFCMASVIFRRGMNTESLTDDLCKLLLDGIASGHP
jgi:TetR/AcrR family fatty acid metabolism transcriptional regulator